MGPPVSNGNNMPSGPPVIIEDVHNMGPWSAGPSCTGYYVGQVARIIRNLSLKGLVIRPTLHFASLNRTSNFNTSSAMFHMTAQIRELRISYATWINQSFLSQHWALFDYEERL